MRAARNGHVTEQRARRTGDRDVHEPRSWPWCPVKAEGVGPGKSGPLAGRAGQPRRAAVGCLRKRRCRQKGAVGGRREQRRRPVQPLPFSWTLGGGTPGVQASARSGKTCRAESDAVCGQRSGFGLGDRPVSGTVHRITPSQPRDTLPGQEFIFHMKKPQAQHPTHQNAPQRNKRDILLHRSGKILEWSNI